MLPDYDRLELDGVCQLALSSGTSGIPKAIKITSKIIVSICICAASKGSLVVTSDDVALVAQPLAHTGGLHFAFLFAYAGANLVVTDYPGSTGLLKISEKYRLIVAFAVPSVLNFLSKYDQLEQFDLSSLKYILTGATTPNFEAIDKLIKRSGNSSIVVKNVFGTSETQGMVFCTNDFMKSKIESVGVAMPGVCFKIVDLDDSSKVITEPHKSGQLLLKQFYPYLLYFNSPQKTKESLTTDGFYMTGDLASFDDNFNIYILSRIKDVVKYRGFSVSPAELEAVLMESPLVADCAVVAEPHEAHVEIPVAFIVPSETEKSIARDVLETSLLELVSQSVAEHKRIRKVYFLERIPRNANGKVLKRILRDTFTKDGTTNQ